MIPPGGKCPRRIGYLFPHPCDRLTAVGCPDCNGGEINDPYAQRDDRWDYTDYDDYGDYGASSGQSMDFTEADGENLVKPEEEEFEDDMNES